MATDGDRAEYTVQSAGEDAPHCWICQEEDTDESGEPLRRDCSCRGSDSGFAHLSCIVEYVKHQTNQWDARNFDKLRMLWLDCPCCKQRYQNELGVELATEFVSFVKINYSGDQGIHLIALSEKLESLERMVNLDRCTLQTKQEAKDIANKILSLIKQVKAEESPLLKRDKYIEPFTYNCLGIIAMKEGTKDSLKEALAHFKKHRDLSILLGLTDEVIVAENNIEFVKEKCGVVISIEKKVEQSQKLYDMRLKRDGKGAPHTIMAGTSLAVNLTTACRFAEAEGLLIKLAAVSKQVHGSDHSLTKEIHSVQSTVNLFRLLVSLVVTLVALASIYIIWGLLLSAGGFIHQVCLIDL